MFSIFSRDWKKNSIYNNLEIFFLTFTVLLFIFRTAIPFLKYPFLVFYVSFLFYSQIKYWSKIKLTIAKYIYTYSLAILLAIILLLSFLLSNKLQLVIFKDLFNIFVLFTFFYFYNLVITTKKQFAFFVNDFILLSIFFAFIVSIIGLFGDSFIFDISSENTFSIDYNFALIPVFFGLFGVLYKLVHAKYLSIKILYNLLLLIFTFDILLTGSRRGLIALFIIVTLIIAGQIINLIKKNDILNKLSLISGYYLGSLFIISLFSYLFVFQTSYEFKNKSLKLLGAENVFMTKRVITRKVVRYISFIDRDLSYNKLLDKIWSHEFNPKDPESGWGSRIHRVEYPLKGKNVQIVPKDTKGYLMDSSCNAHIWNNNSYSYTKFIDVKVNECDQIKALVYCYVSTDFDGSWVKISSEGSSFGNKTDYYDLERKGEWQKLIIKPECNDGNVPIFLYFSKYGVTDFSSLKGYVIYAYPTYEIIGINNNIKSDSLYTNAVNFLNENTQNHVQNNNIIKASIVNSNIQKIPLLIIQKLGDIDLIRNRVKDIFNEDTTYYGYKANIKIERDPQNTIGERTYRWKFAWQIFTQEYNWRKRIFGGGFDHLNWYGYFFLKDKTKSDWPHNPFLSVLLYSGIIGLGLYLYLMFRVIIIYLKYIKEYYILFIFFCIIFFFSFFSAGSPFDPPVMGFFMMFPFFIDYIHKKDKANKIEIKNKIND